jgi:hypothetical protein
VSCPLPSLCVAVGTDQQGGANEAFVSTDPAGGESAWTQVRLPGKDGIAGVSCNTASICVAITSNGYVLATSDPAGGPKAWTSTDIYPYEPTRWGSDVSCVVGLCAIASDGGHATVVTATNPTGGLLAWNGDDVGDFNDLTMITCASRALCLIADDFGILYWSKGPARSAMWHAIPSTFPRGNGNPFLRYPPSAASCTPGGFCAVGEGGTVLTSSHPTWGGWQRSRIDNTPFSISCPSSSLCVALDSRGRVVVGS